MKVSDPSPYILIHSCENLQENHFDSILFQEVYLTTFKAYCVSSPDFVTIVEKYRLQGIGPEEDLYSEGNLRHDHVDLCILVSGKMTVWCDGLPIHGIYPGKDLIRNG